MKGLTIYLDELGDHCTMGRESMSRGIRNFGHSGQSEVSENSPKGFPMPKNMGIDTKIKSIACSEQQLQI